METEQRIDEKTRRRRRRKGRLAIRNRQEEEGSVQEEGIDVQGRTAAIRNRNEDVEPQEGGIGGERRKGKSVVGNRKEAKMSDSEVQQEVERISASLEIARKNVMMKCEEERRSWLCHLPEFRRGKEKVGEAEQKNLPTNKEKETVVRPEAAEPPTIKETPQDTKAAANEQLRGTRKKKGLKSGLEDVDSSDPMAVEAATFRHNWEAVWTGIFGSYEDITRIPPMVYTDKKREPGWSPLTPMETLQVFSVKIAETSQGLPWPLQVFGMVVARDVLDNNRNIIFHRTRDNCQIISEENPYLELTGPSRAVVVLDPVHFEAMLQVKGSVQSEDKVISFAVAEYDSCYSAMKSRVLKRVCPNKLSTMELTLGSIVRSVEATISVQVVGGSWPDGFRGEFTASTISLDDMKIQLLAFGDGKFPVAADGMVKLSRHVVSVELKGELRVSVRAVGDQAVEMRDSKVFRAQRASRCKTDVEVGSYNMKVTVAWSLLSDFHSL